MVAVSIFVVVALIATGAFITANRVNQKAQAIKIVMDNLNYAMDNMVLKIRKGAYYYCLDSGGITDPPTWSLYASDQGQDCGGSDYKDALAFRTPKYGYDVTEGPQKVIYRFVPAAGSSLGKIQLWQESNTQSLTGGNFLDITSEFVNITGLRFYVMNPNSNSRSTPRVTIIVKGEARIGGQVSDFVIQTTAAERQ